MRAMLRWEGDVLVVALFGVDVLLEEDALVVQAIVKLAGVRIVV